MSHEPENEPQPSIPEVLYGLWHPKLGFNGSIGNLDILAYRSNTDAEIDADDHSGTWRPVLIGVKPEWRERALKAEAGNLDLRIEAGSSAGRFAVFSVIPATGAETCVAASATREEVEEMCEELALMRVTKMLDRRFGEIEADLDGKVKGDT